MPDISLLQPQVLRGVVEKLTAPESMILLNRVPKQPWPFPAVTWDVVSGSRTIASPNVPNSEAQIVSRLTRSQKSASFVYTREKRVFEPTTLHWLREPGQLAKVNAEAAVLREVQDLDNRANALAEYCLWKALTGTLTFDSHEVQATVDYGFASSHKPSAGTAWATATPSQIVDDVRAWKRLIIRDGRVAAKDAYATEVAVANVFDSFASTGASNAPAGALLSDRMKDEYYQNGVIPGFMGLNWNLAESVYEASNGTITNFLDDNHVVIGNFDENRPIELMEGPTADDEAPGGFTGKFSKTWKEKDPSARQILLEWHFLPVITRTEQFVYADLT